MPTSNKTEKLKEKNKANQVESQSADNENRSSVLNKFWGDFLLSPIKGEHNILTRFFLLSFFAIVPILLLFVASYLDARIHYEATDLDEIIEITFRDLGDPIFTFCSLALIFAALVYRFRWYPAIRNGFQSLFDNKVLFAQDEELLSETTFLEYLEEYRLNLHSRKRYFFSISFILLLLVITLYISISRELWDVSWSSNTAVTIIYILHTLPRWVIAPIMWGYLAGLGVWTILATTKAIMGLTPRFTIRMQPLRSDNAGGLNYLGALCNYVGLALLVVLIPISAMAVLGTKQIAEVRKCDFEMSMFVHLEEEQDASFLNEKRLAECIYFARGGAFNRDTNLMRQYIIVQAELFKGGDLVDLVIQYKEWYGYLFEEEYLNKRYSSFYALYIILAITTVFAFFIVIRPLWDIHETMIAYKQELENDINIRISKYHSGLTKLIREDNLDEASKLQSKIKLLREELTGIKKYPNWPFSFLPTLRSYLTPGLVTTLITAVFSLLNFSTENKFAEIIRELIKSLLGIS